MKKLLFIINPISGGVDKSNLPNLIRTTLDTNLYDYQIVFTERRGHATHLAAEALRSKTNVVVAVGGDGTINEVARSLVNSSVLLGVIPLGSGNALAHHLQIPVNKIQDAIQLLNTGKSVNIDTLQTNHGEVLCFAGVALEAVAARKYSHLGKRGFFAYVVAALQTVFSYNSEEISYEIDSVRFTEIIYMFTIYNAKFLGYKIGKVEGVSLKDERMQIVIIQSFKKWKLPYIALLILLGKIHLAKEAKILSAKKVKIELGKKSHVQMDGDAFITSSDYILEVNPLSLKVIVPQDLKEY